MFKKFSGLRNISVVFSSLTKKKKVKKVFEYPQQITSILANNKVFLKFPKMAITFKFLKCFFGCFRWLAMYIKLQKQTFGFQKKQWLGRGKIEPIETIQYLRVKHLVYEPLLYWNLRTAGSYIVRLSENCTN